MSEFLTSPPITQATRIRCLVFGMREIMALLNIGVATEQRQAVTYQIIDLPPGSRVIGLAVEKFPACVEVYVEHESFEECGLGEVPRKVVGEMTVVPVGFRKEVADSALNLELAMQQGKSLPQALMDEGIRLTKAIGTRVVEVEPSESWQSPPIVHETEE